MRKRSLVPLILAFAVGPSGCASIFGEDCISLRSSAIVVAVTNAPTGSIPASGVTLIVRGDQYDSVTTMHVPGALQAGDRPGKYDVVVRQSGYRDFSQRGVNVGSASCNNPITVSLSVVLQPL